MKPNRSPKNSQRSSSTRVKLKHIAQEIDREPHWMRVILRRHYGNLPAGKTWEWKTEKEAARVRKLFAGLTRRRS
jgi:hypothetical protein